MSNNKEALLRKFKKPLLNSRRKQQHRKVAPNKINQLYHSFFSAINGRKTI